MLDYGSTTYLHTPENNKMTITHQDRQNVHSWARETLAKFNLEHLNVQIGWGSRFTSRLGEASVDGNNNYRIRFSVPLWPHASEKEKHECVVHEICHIVDFWSKRNIPGYVADGGHGYKWQSYMRKAGISDPARCHAVKPKEVIEIRRPINVTCGCSVIQITKNRATKMKNGHRYLCSKCRNPIRFV
jgi:predicted SprT family Zn-dependent metalloprotease